jgi:type IV pilus assembly protein PilB
MEESLRLINEIKVVSGLAIDKSFVPQEGRIGFWEKDTKRDVRVTIIPTGNTESVHLRIISNPNIKWNIDNLGFSEEDKQAITKVLKSPSGLILITGQTGSGKTTTLYTLATELDLRTSIATSIEDPVEFNLPCLRQLQVDEKHDLSMPEGLKALLRTDPDIIVVGEIRDDESAITTTRAALADQLVLATIHAKSISHAVETLHYMSVPYYILGSVLRMMINQKLARKLCKDCSKGRPPTKDENKQFNDASIDTPKEIFDPVGCDICHHHGYQGQIGIFEMVIIDDDDAKAICSGLDQQKLKQHFSEKGVKPILSDGLQKVADGITSMDEIHRIF